MLPTPCWAAQLASLEVPEPVLPEGGGEVPVPVLPEQQLVPPS